MTEPKPSKENMDQRAREIELREYAQAHRDDIISDSAVAITPWKRRKSK